MITIIVSRPDLAWVDATAAVLHRLGMKVVRIGTLSIVSFLLTSDRIAGILVHEDTLPSDWDVIRERMAMISPNSKIVVVARDDKRSPDDLASLVTA
jgi:hypothetical protein